MGVAICLLQQAKDKEIKAEQLSTLQEMHRRVLEDYEVQSWSFL